MKFRELVTRNYTSILLLTERITSDGIPWEKEEVCISFSRYLNIKFPEKNLFVENDELDKMFNQIEQSYPGFKTSNKYDYEYFLKENLLSEKFCIPIDSLKFYQDEIELDRLDKLVSSQYFNEPVLLVKLNDDFILLNGYHRVFIRLLNEEFSIYGSIIKLE